MAYESGSASNATDLLDKLRVFLVAQGWTQNKWEAISGGYRLHLNKNSVFVKV